MSCRFRGCNAGVPPRTSWATSDLHVFMFMQFKFISGRLNPPLILLFQKPHPTSNNFCDTISGYGISISGYTSFEKTFSIHNFTKKCRHG